LLKARLDKHNEAAQGTDLAIPYIHMDVNDDDSTRYRKWHEDFASMEYRVFMSTLQLGGESINLTPAHHLIFLDRSWSPKDNNQGIGRIRRPGQTSVPVVININALRTTDQYIEQVNDIKNGWFRQIFSDE
jgi:SNF2 family DNA or RNA helicase